jgi:Enolase C-terminal domain-like
VLTANSAAAKRAARGAVFIATSFGKVQASCWFGAGNQSFACTHQGCREGSDIDDFTGRKNIISRTNIRGVPASSIGDKALIVQDHIGRRALKRSALVKISADIEKNGVFSTGVWDVGGISPALKCAHLAESFHMLCEIHGSGAVNLAVCATIQNTTYYERGLLHPLVDYEHPPAYLNRIDDEMDHDGYVHLRDVPGLGHDINHAYIEDNLA